MIKRKGFTLIELLIVVAIIGIIGAIAYPSYADSARKARRSDGKTAMLSVMLAQQKFRGNCPTYANGLGSTNDCDNSVVKALSSTENDYYTISLSGASANSYIVKATAKGVQTSDAGCTALTISVSAAAPKGIKAPADCW